MNKLLIRILAGLFLTMLAGSCLRLVVLNHLYGDYFTDPTWYPVQSTATLVQDIINNTPLPKIYKEQTFLAGAINCRIDIVDRATAPESIRGQLSNDQKMVYGLSEKGEKMFYAPVHGAYLAVIDPSFQSYRPSVSSLSYVATVLWVSLVAAIIGFLLSSPFNRRLNDLEATVKKIRQGEIWARTQINSSDLIGSIGRCFNQMADRIQSMILGQRTLLASVLLKFQAATARISDLVGELAGGKTTDEITATSQKIDAVIDDIDQFVRDLLLNEKNIASENGPAEKLEMPETSSQATQSTFRSGNRKFFFRTALGILIALALNHLFGLFMSLIGYQNMSFDPTWYPTHTTAVLTKRAADIAPPGALPQRLEALRETLKRRIDFLPAGTPLSLSGAVPTKFDITYGVYEGRKVYTAPLRSGAGTLVIDLDLPMYREGPSLLFHLVELPAEFVFIILGSMLLSLPIIVNLKKLEAGIQKIREGDLTARVDVPRSNPVGQLAGGFNEMAERIQALLIQQRHLVQAVAHEVRTPVSRIRFHLEMLLEDGTEAHRRIEDIMEEINELNLLTGELQTFTTLDSPRESFSRTSLPVHDILAEMVAYLQKAHARLSLVLINPAEKEITVSAHPVLFRRAIQNILSNAIRHTQSNVFIHYHADPDGILIDIGDDGPGIPEDARETVFDPFIRLDGSRNRNTGGFGLGLAIVQRILALHGGTVSIADNSPQGTIITTFWPHQAADSSDTS